MKHLVKLLLILSVVSLAACRKTPQVGAGSRPELQRFAFNKSDNEGVVSDEVAVRSGNDLFVTVPEGTDLTRLVPDIRVSDGCKVYISNVQYVKGNKYDFSWDSQIIKLVSEDNSRSNYFTIQVRNGDADIDNPVYEYMRKYSIPAVSLSYALGEKEVYTAAYGYPATKYMRRCTPETLFRIAGVSQAICAICIMACKEDGLISLDDKIFAPGGLLESQNTCLGVIQVKHLLSHGSGLDDTSFGLLASSFNLIIDWLRYDSLPQGVLISDNPGDSFYYSRYGYCILQKLLEIVTDQSYDEYLKSVMARAGISAMRLGNDSMDEYGANECVYYARGTEDSPYWLPIHELAGAIGVIATPRDLTRLLISIDRGTVVPDILQSESVGEMFTPFPYSEDDEHSYGYGWNIQASEYLKNAYYNYGSMCGSTAICAIFPETGVCASLACNASHTGDFFQEDIFQKDTEHLFARIAEIIKSKH